MSDRSANIMLENTTWQLVNPATEDKQDDIITSLWDVSTETKQDTIITWLSNIETNQTDWTQIVQARLYDWAWNPISSLLWAIDIHNADVHTDLINRHFMIPDWATESPSVAVDIGDVTILVASTTGFTVGDDVVINDLDGFRREYHFVITAISVNTSITLDRPTDRAYTTSAVIERVSENLAVDGSTTVISFIQPPPEEVWHITRIILSILDGTAMDDSKFGWIASLTNGVVIRENNSDGYHTLTDWKNNSDMIEDYYDLNYSTKASSGQFWLRGRWTFTNAGAIIKLDGAQGDKLELLIQDDLTDLIHFGVKAQWHTEGI